MVVELLWGGGGGGSVGSQELIPRVERVEMAFGPVVSAGYLLFNI